MRRDHTTATLPAIQPLIKTHWYSIAFRRPSNEGAGWAGVEMFQWLNIQAAFEVYSRDV
ncbi:hypothetical protein BH11GEM2_BH11GEM2_40010 [soil metagenome]